MAEYWDFFELQFLCKVSVIWLCTCLLYITFSARIKPFETSKSSDFVFNSVHGLETNVVMGIEDLQQRNVLNFHHLNYQLPQIRKIENCNTDAV